MSFAERLAEDRRLCILRLLVEADGRANESVLSGGLTMLGLDAGLTRDVVRGDLGFLEERGLICQTWFNEKLIVAQITRRGVECAKGQLKIEGIAKPSIGV